MNHVIKHNPLATDGFEFVEFTAPSADGIAQLHGLFEMMGFTAVARHRRKDVTLFRQNDINFLVNATPYTPFQQFAHAHGDRKSVVTGKSVSVRVAPGGRRILKKKKNNKKY